MWRRTPLFTRITRFAKKIVARRLFEKCIILQQFNTCCIGNFGMREELLALPSLDLTKRFQQVTDKYYPRSKPKTKYFRKVLEVKFKAL